MPDQISVPSIKANPFTCTEVTKPLISTSDPNVVSAAVTRERRVDGINLGLDVAGKRDGLCVLFHPRRSSCSRNGNDGACSFGVCGGPYPGQCQLRRRDLFACSYVLKFSNEFQVLVEVLRLESVEVVADIACGNVGRTANLACEKSTTKRGVGQDRHPQLLGRRGHAVCQNVGAPKRELDLNQSQRCVRMSLLQCSRANFAQSYAANLAFANELFQS
ncbi:unnamed protein product [Clonostachys byssicola]|uniref:Uncharacterized protein n=1 Tax=Clonostachys byssicola TaxID=160290 RepID=A0A9N9UA81_9HYPO|nr:unnamed protein product [Clonostachys byssicola]